MMKIIFTLCSNNYICQARILAASVREHQPSWKFILGLVDAKDGKIEYGSLGFDILEASMVEPEIGLLAQKYSIVELNTCLKPSFFQYLFQHPDTEAVVYMDPDTRLFGPMTELEDNFRDHNVFLTPHLYNPIPLDDHTPAEKLFLNYGIYNLGFLALRRTEESSRFLSWWKERTYAMGYDRPSQGMFTDQLWINLAPVFFKGVLILQHSGYNMGPWNLHERTLECTNGSFRVSMEGSEAPLVFYHFSGFNPAVKKFHYDYTRFDWDHRPDLHQLYDDYSAHLQKERFSFYRSLPCHYVEIRKEFLRLQQQRLEEETAAAHARLPGRVKWTRQIKRCIPAGWKKLALNFIKA